MSILKHNSRGHLRHDGTLKYYWRDDELYQVVKPGKVTVEYSYDFDGILTERKVSATNGHRSKLSFCRDGHLILEIHRNGKFFREYKYNRNAHYGLEASPVKMSTSKMTYRIQSDFTDSVHRLCDDSSGELVESYSYDKYGRISRIYGKDELPKTFPRNKRRWLSPLLYHGQFYDPITGLINYLGTTWFNARLGVMVSRKFIDPTRTYRYKGPSSPDVRPPTGRTRAEVKELLKTMHVRARERGRELKDRKEAVPYRKAGFLKRYGYYWVGVGKGVGTMVKEVVLLPVDTNGFVLESVSAGFDSLVGGDMRFHYEHDPVGGLGKMVLHKTHEFRGRSSYWDAMQMNGSLGKDTAKGIIMLPVEFGSSLSNGNPVKTGETTTYMAAFLWNGRIGIKGGKTPNYGAALDEAFAAYAREVQPKPKPLAPAPSPAPAPAVPVKPIPVPFGERLPAGLPEHSFLLVGDEMVMIGPGMKPRPGFKFNYEGTISEMEGMVSLRAADVDAVVGGVSLRTASNNVRSSIHELAELAGLERQLGPLYIRNGRGVNKGRRVVRNEGSRWHETPLFGRGFDVQSLPFRQHGMKGVRMGRHHRPRTGGGFEGGTRQILIQKLRELGIWTKR